MRTLVFVVATLVAPGLAADAIAQNTLDEARRHYDAAEYEEALAVLGKADRTSRTQVVEVEQYRAFCLIALGRMSDAEKAVAALVEADPLYVPSASPRVQSLMSDIRRKTLPVLARRILEDGRKAYTQKEHDRAREQFQLLQKVLADPAMQGRPETTDLQVLADGFVTLMAASPEPAPPAAAAPMAAPTPALTTSPALELGASVPADTALAKPTAGERPEGAAAIVPAVAIREVLPPWTPDRQTARFEYAGAMRVTIGTDGKVKTASIQDPSHPIYDARLLQAARSWLYKPALRNGEPVEFEKVLEIRLRPPSGP